MSVPITTDPRDPVLREKNVRLMKKLVLLVIGIALFAAAYIALYSAYLAD